MSDFPVILLASACQHGLEGIIAKRKDSPYRSGHGGEWRKIKCIQSDRFFIIGWEPSNAAYGGLGRLLLVVAPKRDSFGVRSGFSS